jgi:hypothetical protein
MENNRSVSTQGTERTTTEIPNKEQIKADASGVVHKAKNIKAKNIGREQIESGKQTAASQAEQFPNDSLQNRSVDELVTDIRDMVRTTFILGSVVIGIGISRFFKPSAERRQHYEN